MKSYESCKWYEKIWRKRWYFLIPFLYLKVNIFKISYVDWIIEGEPTGEDDDRLWNTFWDIKRHLDLTKLHKYSA